uniref:RRM domain-containing protein n=1 Tax=Piliocolobus tephrosceles TaxID=591936 RepID=A0A8C9IGS2_9PRIM
MSCGRPPPDVDGMITLKVDNLTYRTTPDSLKRVFEKYGRVGDVYIPREHHTKAPRGFAFVRFHNRRDAEDAEDAMDGAELDGRGPPTSGLPATGLSTTALTRSLGLALALHQPPNPALREDPSPPPSPDLAQGPGLDLRPGVLPPYPRGNPSPGRDPRVLPGLLKGKKDKCPPRKMIIS